MVRVGSARIDERGQLSGGQAGDQTGQEVAIEPWYLHSKGWVIIRAKDSHIAERIAVDMEMACNNNLIGYDQSTSWDLYDKVRQYGWDCSKLKVAAETDCSSLVRTCVAYATGKNIPWFSTLNQVIVLSDTGYFDIITDAKYTCSPDYVRRGDILCTRTQGHTVVVLDNGSMVGTSVSGRFAMPEGYLDYADKTKISGWAYDGTDARLTVHIYIYKNGQKVDLFPVTANVFRSDLKSAGKGDGNHAFNASYDFAAKLGVGSYTIKAFAINQAGANNPQLQGVKTVNITQATSWTGKATTDVYARADANASAKAITVLKTGQTVQVTGTKAAPDGGTWYRINYNGQIAYVNSRFIVKA